MSTEAEKTSPSPASGAGLFQRVSSFLVGAGLTALTTQYFIFEEVRAGNQAMLKKQSELESRLYNLEKSQKKK